MLVLLPLHSITVNDRKPTVRLNEERRFPSSEMGNLEGVVYKNVHDKGK